MSDPIPRLDLDALGPELRALLAPRVERLKYLGEFFRCAGHQPKALAGFIAFTEHAKKPIPTSIVEVIALSIAQALGNAYERNQHERLSVRVGLGRAWVEAVEQLDPDAAPLLSDAERDIQRFALSAVRTHGKDSSAAFKRVVDHFGPEVAMAIMMVVSRYAAHALMVNTLRLAPPVPSIWEDGFSG